MKVRIITVPYDSGHYGARMGAGPLHLREEGGLADRLAAEGAEVEDAAVEVDLDFPTENTVAFEVARRLSSAVRAAREDGGFPLVLAGNCASCLGTVAGLGASRTGVVWLDAHGDFNTPETTGSGFLDGMALSMLVGDCWRKATGSVPGFEPVPEDAVLLVGARALDPGEGERLERSGVGRLGIDELEGDQPNRALARVADRADSLYLHVDLDVVDPAVARANPYAAPGGLTLEGLLEFVGRVARAGPVGAMALTAYAPSADPDDGITDVAEAVVGRVLEER